MFLSSTVTREGYSNRTNAIQVWLNGEPQKMVISAKSGPAEGEDCGYVFRVAMDGPSAAHTDTHILQEYVEGLVEFKIAPDQLEQGLAALKAAQSWKPRAPFYGEQ
jgi:hypothetical protein